jgi:hypothetical protein
VKSVSRERRGKKVAVGRKEKGRTMRERREKKKEKRKEEPAFSFYLLSVIWFCLFVGTPSQFDSMVGMGNGNETGIWPTHFQYFVVRLWASFR